VAGTPDLVDVDFDIKEGLPGQFGGGLGYSDAQKLMLNLNFVHTNFMGTGNRIAANINTGKFSKAYSVSHTDPYTTIDAVSRTVSFTYRNITQFTSSSSDFSTETIAASVEYGYPVTEYQRVILGFSWQKAQLLADPNGSSVQAFQWVNNNGNECSTGTIITCSEFNTFELIAGWIKDTRNRSLFANRGSQHRLTLTGTIPGSDVEYYTFNYHFRQYVPLGRWFTLSINADFGFGDSFGDTTSIAPFKQYFAGGPNTVRGFKEDTLGPIDSRGNPYGGNMLIAAQTEIILPMPQKWASRARFTAFFDIGNVFSTGGVDFWGPPGFPGPNGGVPTGYKFDADELKQSVGLAAQWLAPMGLFRFSYAFPLNDSERTPFRFADQVEQFQFSIGGAF
jgi:outer membrane protein insertion porin family